MVPQGLPTFDALQWWGRRACARWRWGYLVEQVLFVQFLNRIFTFGDWPIADDVEMDIDP